MIDRLRALLRSDDFIPSSSIFPDVDAAKIGRDLRLKERAIARGETELPPTGQTSLDGIEMDVVTRVEDARRKGLENYEHNRSVYSRRLRAAHTARSEIDTIAGTARGDFAKEVKAYRSEMARVQEDVVKWNEALRSFRLRHGLERPAYDRPRLLVTLVIVLAFLFVETILNGVLFAGKNELGLLGGGFIAFLISIVNVGLAGLCGVFARYARYHFWLCRPLGWVAFLFWFAGSVGLNLAVAHFRDAVETLETWREATFVSMDNLFAAPLELGSMEAWLLLSWGMLISIITFLKFLLSGETYPGYAKISERRLKAVKEFEDLLSDALASLEERRDDAIASLKDANELVRERIGDAIDALYGRRMMHGHLQAFLDQCDMKATTLLKQYRDENRAARSSEAPAYFDSEFRFAPFVDVENPVEGDQRRIDAERKVEEVERVVDETIAAIHEEYRAALDAYANTEDLLSGEGASPRERMRRARPTVVVSGNEDVDGKVA